MAKMEKKPISPVQKLLGTSLSCYGSSPGEADFPEQENPALNGLHRVVFFPSIYPVKETFALLIKIPVYMCIIYNTGGCVHTPQFFSAYTHVLYHPVNPLTLRDGNMYPHTGISSEFPVLGRRQTPGSQVTVIKGGNKANDLENV